MTTAHLFLAVALAAAWGFNFVVITAGLDHFPPLLFNALRFFVAAVPAIFFLRHPGVPWRWVALVALTLGVLKFSLLFFGMAEGMPPGLSSLVLQSQALFTAILATTLLGERLGGRQKLGLLVAFVGVGLIALDLGATAPLTAFALAIGAAAMWGVSNVIIRKAAPPDNLRFMVWVGALAVLPLTTLSLIVDGPRADWEALRTVPWSAVAAVLYVGLVATVLGFGTWGYLIRTYSASTVAPFSLLVPVFGMGSAWLFVDESVSLPRILAGLLIVGGVLVGVIGVRRPERITGTPTQGDVGEPTPVR
ncbi:O-acetylserine/cysteine efflux transporter [Herbihabitans rhizosphaerae]|uniref:O-acetylserine/cysteine efflux transporter n=2 Tax=Herbihabitans rhizosphaerae TaxID=1872711 RepID=A0A4Q7KR79_9PSEU|nr:O-acetylserine/cysteine efflux transporter [Herbihabitans rhizosphaerae]